MQPALQQLRAAVPLAGAEAVQAGMDFVSVHSSASIEFVCRGDRMAVITDGTALSADIFVCCGHATPSHDLLQALQSRSVQARILQNAGFAVITTSNRRLSIESMLPRMLNVPELSSTLRHIRSNCDSSSKAEGTTTQRSLQQSLKTQREQVAPI